MIDNFDVALSAVLHHEGGFVKHPSDPGGMTNLGCTKATWENWCGHTVTEKDMRELTKNDVGPLYKQKYWDAAKCNDLPVGLDYVVFDAAINSGPGRAIKFLQEAIDVTADGIIGPKTLLALKAMDTADLIEKYCAKRLQFLKELPKWEVFGKGWGRRVDEVRVAALKMI